ncbi:hypothetical protein FoTM2_017201 [Fusarium oxysporum f. sp. vasinfectum]|nr:hypothetical protein FoTM2_017201 [Fusarium oxysporum f. sp. vasinfectum]
MQSKSIPCQLLGYQGSTNYILLDERGRVFVSNNVVFSENIKNVEPTLDNLTHQMSDQRPSQRRRVVGEEDSDVENAIVLEPSPLPIASREANRSGETGRGETTPDEPPVGDTGWDPDQESTRSSIHVATDEREVSSEETEKHAESRLPERSTRGQLPSRYILASTNFAFLATVAEQLYLVARDIDQSEPRTFKEATQGKKTYDAKERLQDLQRRAEAGDLLWIEEDLQSQESLQDRAKMGVSRRSSADKKKTRKFRIALD